VTLLLRRGQREQNRQKGDATVTPEKKKLKRGAGREDVSKQMVKNEAQRIQGSTAFWAGRR